MLDYQERRIKIIKNILPQLGENFILKGGTALTLFYNCPRFSEDIDLDSKTNNMNFLNHLKIDQKWQVNIKKDTNTVFRAMIDYGDKKNGGNYPLKIEVSSRNKNFIGDKDYEYSKINGIYVYNLDVIAKMKVQAFLSRTKARDIFDIGYLLNLKEDIFDKRDLHMIYDEIGRKSLDELSAILKIEQYENKTFKNIDTDEFVLKMEQTCLEKLSSKSLLKDIKDYEIQVKFTEKDTNKIKKEEISDNDIFLK